MPTTAGAAMTEARPTTATSGPAAVLESLPLSGWYRRLVVLVGIGSFSDLYEVFLGGVLAPLLAREWALGPVGKAAVVSSGPGVHRHLPRFRHARAAGPGGHGFDISESLGYAALSFAGYPLGSLASDPLVDRFERKWLIIGTALAIGVLGIVFAAGHGRAGRGVRRRSGTHRAAVPRCRPARPALHRTRAGGAGSRGHPDRVSQALYEITVNALLDRDRPITRPDWDAAVARVGGHRVPQLLAELTDAGLVGADLLPGAVAEAWASADRPLDRLPAARWRELFGDAGLAPPAVTDGSSSP